MRDRDIEGIRLFWAREQKVEERLVKEEVVRMARSHIQALAREALDRGVPSRGDGSHSYRCGVCSVVTFTNGSAPDGKGWTLDDEAGSWVCNECLSRKPL